MVGLLTGIQKVELVGGESWLSSHLGSILLAVAAIAGAALAAYVAVRNHGQQLEHDRELRKREATRSMLDDVAQLTTDVIDKCTDLYLLNRKYHELGQGLDEFRCVDQGEVDLEEIEQELKEVTEETKEVGGERTVILKETGDLLFKTLYTATRLQFRFADDDPIVVNYNLWCDSLKERFDLIADLGDSETSIKEQEDAIAEAGGISNKKLREFQDSVRKWFI